MLSYVDGRDQQRGDRTVFLVGVCLPHCFPGDPLSRTVVLADVVHMVC